MQSIILLFVALLLGCKEEMEEFEQIDRWCSDQQELHQTRQIFARAKPFRWQVHQCLSGEVKLAAYDVLNGERVWEWDDFIEPPSDFVYQERLMFQKAMRAYCIDAVNGDTNMEESSTGQDLSNELDHS